MCFSRNANKTVIIIINDMNESQISLLIFPKPNIFNVMKFQFYFTTFLAPQNDAPKKFDEKGFMGFLKDQRIEYTDITGKGRPINEEMFNHIPPLKRSNFQDLNSFTKNSNEGGFKKLCEVFP